MRFVFHLDMDSFFATAEQQANPFLRGRPIVVSGKEGSRSVIVASSKEAKLLGIKTGFLPSLARRICPRIIFVEPDGEKYEMLSRRLHSVLTKYTDTIEIFSIDEAFLDFTGYVNSFVEAEVVIAKIKADVRTELGEWVTCSVGVAENKFLAKLGSDKNKPDGFFFITEENKIEILNNSRLTDFCGIGSRLEKRLDNLGINSVRKLRDYPLEELIKEFGPSAGNHLHDMSLGIDHSPVIAECYRAEVKSVSRSYTLPRNTLDKEEILGVLLHLVSKIGRDLRQKGLSGKTIVVYFRYEDFTHSGFRITLPECIDDELIIFELAEKRLSSFNLLRPVRLVGAYISNLAETRRQLSIWQEERKRNLVLPYLDKINDRYGELTVKPAYLLKAEKLRKKVGGFRI